MTIYEIKRLTAETLPHYFNRQTMRFFGQTLKDFRVYKQADGRYMITAPIRDRFTGKQQGLTTRFFNPITNTLEHK